MGVRPGPPERLCVLKTEDTKLTERLDQGWPKCEECEILIPLGRLEALPDTKTCVNHSKESAYVGVPNYRHKTAPEIAIVKGDDKEALRRLWRGYHRGR